MAAGRTAPIWGCRGHCSAAVSLFCNGNRSLPCGAERPRGFLGGETGLGTLRASMHLDFDWDAFIELDGMRIGKTDSLFSTLTGHAGNIVEHDLIACGPPGSCFQASVPGRRPAPAWLMRP